MKTTAKTTAKILLIAVTWIGCGFIASAGLRTKECADMQADVDDYPGLYGGKFLARKKVRKKRFLGGTVMFGPVALIAVSLETGMFYGGFEWTNACIDAVQPSEAVK
jgi:hypothetical protein